MENSRDYAHERSGEATREKSEKGEKDRRREREREREKERENHGLASRVYGKSWPLAKSPPLGATTSG